MNRHRAKRAGCRHAAGSRHNARLHKLDAAACPIRVCTYCQKRSSSELAPADQNNPGNRPESLGGHNRVPEARERGATERIKKKTWRAACPQERLGTDTKSGTDALPSRVNDQADLRQGLLSLGEHGWQAIDAVLSQLAACSAPPSSLAHASFHASQPPSFFSRGHPCLRNCRARALSCMAIYFAYWGVLTKRMK